MSHQTLHPSPVKEGRRILGEKNTNACLSPARSPTKQTLLHTPSPKKQLLPSPSFIAQKRPIAQVHAEDATSRLSAQEKRAEARIAQHEAPMADATSAPAPDTMNMDIPEQTTRPTPNEPSTESPNPRTVPLDPETRKHFIQEKATLLRTRLQSAMRHVQDPQIDRRVSELEEHSRKCPRLSGSGLGPGLTSEQGAGYGSGTQLQQHLEQKYGVGKATAGKDAEGKGEEEYENENMLSTPRAQQSQSRTQHQHEEDQREIMRIEVDKEVTPTQTQTERAELETTTDTDTRPASPTQRLLTYNSGVQNPHNGRFDDDRPQQRAREATIATSPSSSLKDEGCAGGNGDGRSAGACTGDGDAVDGLLKLMGTNTGARV